MRAFGAREVRRRSAVMALGLVTDEVGDRRHEGGWIGGRCEVALALKHTPSTLGLPNSEPADQADAVTSSFIMA